ncbi:efflux RND transporter periplasmic adaptor subunit [Candidatus Poribacteria bacterium]|nr:efflux RND transporter periplasmic adaptor subunit [Candidatus Poribacteria bacterium]
MRKKIILSVILILIIAFFGFRIFSRQPHAEAADAKSDMLGMGVRNLNEAECAGMEKVVGVVVAAVHANGSAEKSGIMPNDIILSINDRIPKNRSEYLNILDEELVKKGLLLRIKRNSQELRIRIKTDFAATFNNLGNAYVEEKKYDQAIETYNRAISIDPKMAKAYYNLAGVYSKQDNHQLAIENYKKAISNQENLQEAYQKLAEIYRKQGDYQKALDIYKKVITTSPEDTLESELQNVETIVVSEGEIKNQIKTSGTIQPQTQVTIYPKMPGVIQQVKIDKGDMVKKDQVIAIIEYEELELQVQQAEAALAAAESGLQQTKKLAKTRIMSQLNQAKAGVEAAEAALYQVITLAETQTETQIQQAKAALDALKANQEKIQRGAREEEREQIKATVTQAKAALANARSNFGRMEELYKEKAVSKQTYEGVETQLKVAEAQYEAALQQLKMVENGAREEDINAMDAQIKQAEAVFALAKKQVEKQTWKKDITMAEAQVKQANAGLESAETLVEAKSWEAEIIASETQFTQARVMRDLAKKQLSDAYIKTPVGGIISVRHLDMGNMANPAAPLFEIVDMDVVHANVELTESDLDKVKEGNPAWVHIKSMKEPIQSKITSISPVVDKMSRTVEIEITIDNPQHLIKPGVFAKVFIPTDVRSTTVVLPRSVVVENESNGDKYVFVVESGKTQKVFVEYGLIQGSMVEITSGLKGGEQVVYSGQQNLNDGDMVYVVDVIKEL